VGPGTGEVSEADKLPDRIACGPISLEWSAGDHLYFGDDTFDLALTGATTIEAVDPAAVTWLSHRWGQLAYDDAAHTAATAVVDALR
jgi:hypothetical protein